MSLNELMNYVKEHVNRWVPNLKWPKDFLAKVWKAHKGLSLHVLSLEVLSTTLVREVCWFCGHDLSLR